MKHKILKILFIISFLPYLLALICGIIGAVFGVSFFFSSGRGFGAFIIAGLYALYTLTFVVPIIPVCLIFQICYILRNKVKHFNNINFKKYVKACCIVGSILVLIFIVFSHSYEIEKVIEKNSAKQMIKNAEEKIGFSRNNVNQDGIFDMPEYKYNHVLIDYDKVEVGMLLSAGPDEFWKVKLQKISKESSEYQHIVKDYFMQANIPLNSPGKKLISFYDTNRDRHRTIAFLLIYEDGTIYFADNIKERDTGFTRFTGLNSSEFFIGENVKFDE